MPGAQPQRCNQIDLRDVTSENVKCLQRINQIIFPVNYNEKFYKDAAVVGELAKVVTYNDTIVGGVVCRIDESNDLKRLYIMTLGCLAPYRRRRIGTIMLDHVLNYADKIECDGVYLHVQTNNEIALAFYQKFGFDVIGTEEDYYKRISPSTAFVLLKELKKSV